MAVASPAASHEVPAARRFSGRTAFVTGGGSGIGLAVAEVLAEGGAAVGLLGRNLERLHTAEKKIVTTGGQAFACAGDVRDLGSLQAAVTEVQRRFGPIDLAVNAAGTGVGQKYLCEQDETAWLRTVDTNLNGSFRFCRAIVPGMVERGHGAMVLISSAAGKRGVPANTAYSASKWGINGLVRSLALEVGASHVRVNAVCPGFTDTEMVRDESLFGRDFMDSVRRHAGPPDLTWDRYWRSTVKGTALRRLIDTDEVAEMTAFLLSDHARSITGQAYSIDGGLP